MNSVFLLLLSNFMCILCVLFLHKRPRPRVFYIDQLVHHPSSLVSYISLSTKTDHSQDPRITDYVFNNYTSIESRLHQLSTLSSTIMIHAIGGCDALCDKRSLWVKSVAGTSTHPPPWLPYTWILPQNNSWRRYHTWVIFKKNIQGKKGLKIALPSSSMDDVSNYVVVQKYITNPYCIQGYKVNFRVYMMIQCTPTSQDIYWFPHMKCIYTPKPYTMSSMDFDFHITNASASVDRYKESLPFFFDEPIIGDQIKASVRDIMKQLLIIFHPFLNKTHIRNKKKQLFGCDFMMDDSYQVYLLEINKGPNMFPVNYPQDALFKRSVVDDYFRERFETWEKLYHLDVL